MKKFYPPMYFKIFVGVSIILHFVIPINQIIHSPYNYFGIVLIVLGLILNITADQLFKKQGTVISPDKKPVSMIISGPFRISRNPMYLGMLVALAGVSVLLGSVATIVGPLIFLISMHKIFIPVEEKNMRKIFGERFEYYRKMVRRWI